MSYSDRALAFATIPAGHQVRLEDRVSFAYLDRATVYQNRTGVWAMQDDEGEKTRTRIQLPVGGIAVLALGPGTSITHPAAISLTRSGTTVVFAGNGGANAYSAATPLTSSARWAIAQAHVITDENSVQQAAISLYKRQLGVPMLPGGSVATMRGLEGRTIRNLYKTLAKQHAVTFKRDTKADDVINMGLNLGNSILYGCAAAACTAIGVNPALGIIHRGNSRSLIFDLADLYKPSITIPVAFQSKEGDPEAMAKLRSSLRKLIHQKKVLAGMLDALMEVLAPHLPKRDDDRIIGEAGEVAGHVNYGGDE